MSAELIVVAGPLLGERFALGTAELKIGRAPAAQVRLTDMGAAWDHCVIRPQDGGYRIVDCHTGSGTYVNGMRVREQQLEPGDQIHIGETIFAYREAGAAPDLDSPQHTLLRACSLLFLFRALATAQNEPQRAMLEEQIVALIGDLVPSTGGAVVLGRRVRSPAARTRSSCRCTCGAPSRGRSPRGFRRRKPPISRIIARPSARSPRWPGRRSKTSATSSACKTRTSFCGNGSTPPKPASSARRRWCRS